MPEPVVLVDRVSFAYRGSVPVLEDISFAVERGSVVGLIGPNGGGKTTLVKVILGLLPLQMGRVELFRQPIEKFREWHRIGYLSQTLWSSDRAFPVSVEEVVAMGLVARRGLLRRAPPADRDRIGAALARVGLADCRRASIAHLSAGQQRRVLLARALAGEAELLVLDEPTTTMDPKSQEEFYRLVESLSRDQGMTIILVSHDLAGMTAHVSHIAGLNRRLLFYGPPEAVLASGAILTVYGKMAGTLLSELIAARRGPGDGPAKEV